MNLVWEDNGFSCGGGRSVTLSPDLSSSGIVTLDDANQLITFQSTDFSDIETYGLTSKLFTLTYSRTGDYSYV